MNSLGNLDRVITERLAVTDGKQPTEWMFPGDPGDASQLNIQGQTCVGVRTRKALRVRAVSADDYFGTSRVDFVKMDIEGAAGKALAGMRSILRNQRPVVIVEFHTNDEWSARQELIDAGYLLY